MTDNQTVVAVWIGIGVVRWLIWNDKTSKAKIYNDDEHLKFQIMHLLLFCALGPYWLVSILRGNG